MVVQQHSRKLLKMGILIPETCWVSKKKNKNRKWHLVGFLFFCYHKMHSPLNIRKQWPVSTFVISKAQIQCFIANRQTVSLWCLLVTFTNNSSPQRPVQLWVLQAFYPVEAVSQLTERWSWTLMSTWCWGYACAELYPNSPTYSHTFKRNSLFTEITRPALGPTQPPVHWGPGLFPGNKAAEAWCSQLIPPIAKVKNEWRYTSTSLYAFIACLGKTSPFIFDMWSYIANKQGENENSERPPCC